MCNGLTRSDILYITIVVALWGIFNLIDTGKANKKLDTLISESQKSLTQEKEMRAKLSDIGSGTKCPHCGKMSNVGVAGIAPEPDVKASKQAVALTPEEVAEVEGTKSAPAK